MDFLNRPISATGMLVVLAVCALLIFALRRYAQRSSRRIAKEFLEQNPNAAVLYLYARETRVGGGTVTCRQGTASKTFNAGDAPGFGVSQGVACYLVPGQVEFDATVSWTKDYYLVRRHRQMQAHFSLQAEPGRGYAAVFDPKDQSARIVELEKDGAG